MTASLDLGVHLTLTSEWEGYRWRADLDCEPQLGPARRRRLSAAPMPAPCARQLVPEAAEIEMRAQIDRALAAGIDATHIDTHMGAALVPELLAIYLQPRPRVQAAGAAAPRPGELSGPSRPWPESTRSPMSSAVAELEKAGVPIVDHFRMTPGVPSDEAPAAYRNLLATLPQASPSWPFTAMPPGDIEAIVPPRAHWRTDEHRLFASGAPQRWVDEMGIVRVGYRRLRDLYRSAVSG